MSQRDRHSACRRRLCNTPPKMAATTPGPSLWQGPRSAHRTRSCVGSPAPSEPSCSKNAHNYQSSGLDPGQEHPQKLQIAGASPRDSGGTSAQRLASHNAQKPAARGRGAPARSIPPAPETRGRRPAAASGALPWGLLPPPRTGAQSSQQQHHTRSSLAREQPFVTQLHQKAVLEAMLRPTRRNSCGHCTWCKAWHR